ncbi:MAG TPA: hypothetical protein VIJ10_16060, partial [Vicinamibacteria bacterium]
ASAGVQTPGFSFKRVERARRAAAAVPAVPRPDKGAPLTTSSKPFRTFAFATHALIASAFAQIRQPGPRPSRLPVKYVALLEL